MGLSDKESGAPKSRAREGLSVSQANAFKPSMPHLHDGVGAVGDGVLAPAVAFGPDNLVHVEGGNLWERRGGG